MLRKLVCSVWVVALLSTFSVAGQWIGFGQSNSIDEDGGPSYVIGHDGKIFFNGFDLTIGGQLIKNIAVWDGVSWRDTTRGIPGNSISSMLIDKDGNLLVCAMQPDPANDPEGMSKVMRWDGTKWNPAFSGIEGAITIAKDTAGTIYASIRINREFDAVVKYNGTSWDTLGEFFNNQLGNLMFDRQNSLWACGFFDSVGQVPAAGVAMWDGNAWQPMSNGLLASKTGRKVAINKLIESRETVYATGDFFTALPNSVNGLAKWDGTSWCSVGNLQFTLVTSAESDTQGNLFVSGLIVDSLGNSRSIVAVWNGTQWKQLGGLDEGPGTLIVDYSGNVYGYFGPHFGLIVWRDNAWRPAATENGFNGGVNSIFADTAHGYIYVGGQFSAAGGTTVHNIARWDGQKWQECGKGLYEGVSVITGNATGDIVASARVSNSNAETVLRFSNGVWDTLGKFNFSGNCYTLAFDASGTLYAGGTFDSIGGVAARRIACWNGTVWKALGTGINGDEVRAIAFDKAGNLYAGGKFDVAGSTVAHNIALWDGTSWRALGEGIRKEPTSFHPVNALAVDNSGNVYAGGQFAQAGVAAASNIARWDGTAWYPLAEGISSGHNGVSALAVNPSGTLFAAGSINRAGNVSVNGIAQWDGRQWSSLDDGVYSVSRYDTAFFPGWVQALACDNTTLHVGGIFMKAGGKTSCNFAQYRFSQTAARKTLAPLLYQNVISFDIRQAAFRVHLTSDTHVQVGITNLMGKMIRTTCTKLPRGNHLVPIGTNALPSGVYVVHIKAGRDRSCRRFVVGK